MIYISNMLERGFYEAERNLENQDPVRKFAIKAAKKGLKEAGVVDTDSIPFKIDPKGEYVHSQFVYNFETSKLRRKNPDNTETALTLTPTEHGLLVALVLKPNQCISHQELKKHLKSGEESIKWHISHLSRKIQPAGRLMKSARENLIIQAVRGRGYTLIDERR